MKPTVALDFETLVELYYQPVFTFAVKLCGRLEHALELTQHTFCQALNHQRYLGESQRAKSWLFTLLFREFLKEKRSEGGPESLGEPPRPRSSRAATAAFDALARTRPGLRDPLVLFYAKDLSFSQIAYHLEISVEAVIALLSKGREDFTLALAPSSASNSQLAKSSSTRARRRELLLLAA